MNGKSVFQASTAYPGRLEKRRRAHAAVSHPRCVRLTSALLVLLPRPSSASFTSSSSSSSSLSSALSSASSTPVEVDTPLTPPPDDSDLYLAPSFSSSRKPAPPASPPSTFLELALDQSLP